MKEDVLSVLFQYFTLREAIFSQKSVAVSLKIWYNNF